MANKSANQKYKESKSFLPFKEWLITEQEKGLLQNTESMINADGKIEDSKVAITNRKVGGNMTNIIGFISVVVMSYGIYQETNK